MATELSRSYELLDGKIRRWIYLQEWRDLSDVQELAIPLILEGKHDVILAAPTAAGKTEAAFFPILTTLLRPENRDNVVLYIGPLKALINDQFRRLEFLCSDLDIAVHPWHGDIGAGPKQRFLKKPKGVLQITPESLEALFVNHGSLIPTAFKKLSYIVVDELHSFIGSVRGCQLQSLMHRIEVAVRRSVPRIALSATLGDMQIASTFLRPASPHEVKVINSKGGSKRLKLLLRGYRIKPCSADDEEQAEQEEPAACAEIRDDLYRELRDSDNLVFANTRNRVEYFADQLRRLCEANREPNQFFAHHGSLSKTEREDAEAAIKDPARSVTIVATSTLEMGIDIGNVKSVCQIGAPPSVSSLRQRLGRSGRRSGEAAELRAFVQEQEIHAHSSIQDRIREELFQLCACINLLLRRWCEPLEHQGLNLSTLIQQTLSVIAETGGGSAIQLYQRLCGKGPFEHVSEKLFADFLRCLGRKEVLMQASDGTLLPARVGERMVGHHTFYAAFQTPEEYRLVFQSRELGKLPVTRPLAPNALIIFGGRRWYVESIDEKRKVIQLLPAQGGNPPKFCGGGIAVHDEVRKEMYRLYTDGEQPPYLDPNALSLFAEGRENFRELSLATIRIVADGQVTHLALWRGDLVQNTIASIITAYGFAAASFGALITVQAPIDQTIELIRQVAGAPQAPDPVRIASSVGNKFVDKWDFLLSGTLLDENYASKFLDVDGALLCFRELAQVHGH